MSRITPVSNFFVRIENDLRKSKAWAECTKAEIDVYLELRSRTRTIPSKQRDRGGHYIEKNEITLTYKEAINLGWPRATFSRAIKGLEKKGIIDLLTAGGGQYGRLSIYAISNRWESYGTADFQNAHTKHHINSKGLKMMHKRKRTNKASVDFKRPESKNTSEPTHLNSHKTTSDNGYRENSGGEWITYDEALKRMPDVKAQLDFMRILKEKAEKKHGIVTRIKDRELFIRLDTLPVAV
jgi:hypothetical protein